MYINRHVYINNHRIQHNILIGLWNSMLFDYSDLKT